MDIYNRPIIGTLGEKTLHNEIKHLFCADETKHEIKVGSYVADIKTDYGIIEIQTGAFNKLRKKLTVFLEDTLVTLVYPLPDTKWLLWINEQTGEVTKKRKSPKKGSIYDAVFELYKIKPFLSHKNLRLCIIFADIEEYRFLNGWSKDRKKGSSRHNRIPVKINGKVYFNFAKDYLQFIPENIPENFTTKDLKTAAKINMRTSQTLLNILHHIGTVKRVGKSGNLLIYEKN